MEVKGSWSSIQMPNTAAVMGKFNIHFSQGGLLVHGLTGQVWTGQADVAFEYEGTYRHGEKLIFQADFVARVREVPASSSSLVSLFNVQLTRQPEDLYSEEVPRGILQQAFMMSLSFYWIPAPFTGKFFTCSAERLQNTPPSELLFTGKYATLHPDDGGCMHGKLELVPFDGPSLFPISPDTFDPVSLLQERLNDFLSKELKENTIHREYDRRLRIQVESKTAIDYECMMRDSALISRLIRTMADSVFPGQKLICCEDPIFLHMKLGNGMEIRMAHDHASSYLDTRSQTLTVSFFSKRR